MSNRVSIRQIPKRIYPPALLEMLGEDDYLVDFNTYTVLVDESTMEKVRDYFGKTGVPVANGLLGGGWLWLKESK